MVATNAKIKSDSIAVSSLRQKKTSKQAKAFWLRLQKNAMLKWQEVMHEERNKEAKSELIIKRVRNNFVRQAFNRYKYEV